MSYTDPHEAILSALMRGAPDPNLPFGVSRYDVVQTVLGYGLVRDRVFTLLVEKYAAEVLGQFTALELTGLRKKCRVEVNVAKLRVEWGLLPPEQSLKGETVIVAKSCLEGNPAPYEIFKFKPRTIEEARRIRWHNEGVPGDILWLYDQYLHSPNPAYVAEMNLQRKYAAEKAQKEQGVLKGDIAVAVAAQTDADRELDQ